MAKSKDVKIGNCYGDLLVKSYLGKRKNRDLWLCVCSNCNSEHERTPWNLTETSICKTCHTKYEDLSNQKFGLLTAIEPIRKKGKIRWKCKCDCGNIIDVQTENLKHNVNQRSCGCIKKSRVGNKSPRWKGHGSISGSYWSKIKKEAHNRGYDFQISIQDAWNLFVKQDGKCALSGIKLSMNKPRTASLDRIDNNKGYTKDNIQWVHKDLNIMKNHTLEYFIEMCTGVSNYFERM
jgi:hypothetical protein